MFYCLVLMLLLLPGEFWKWDTDPLGTLLPSWVYRSKFPATRKFHSGRKWNKFVCRSSQGLPARSPSRAKPASHRPTDSGLPTIMFAFVSAWASPSSGCSSAPLHSILVWREVLSCQGSGHPDSQHRRKSKRLSPLCAGHCAELSADTEWQQSSHVTSPSVSSLNKKGPWKDY